ncbi:hypothetical protein [Streptomyces sp. NPDC002490]|uniref:hypothetical protein n=1 Tax=Streptomyces sp. NPDC002490 TaxID=3154416 RepID=UPI0033290C54
MRNDDDPRVALARATAAGRAGAIWDFIRSFAEDWARPLAPEDGCPEGELRERADRLGLALPAAVHEAYALFGRRDDLVRVQDRLLRPAQWEYDPETEVLIVRVENQYAVEWGVSLAGHGDPSDPPVFFRATDEETWLPFLDRFSLACAEMVLSESLFAPGAALDNRALDPVTTARVAELCTPLPLPGYPVWAVPEGEPVRWFHRDGVLLRADGSDWLWARGRDAAALAAARADLPGEWLLDGVH